MSTERANLGPPDTEYLLPGNRLCAGCGLTIAYRFMMKALGPKTIVSVPACCATILHGIYPKTTVSCTTINCTFGSSAASSAGVSVGLKATGQQGWNVVTMAGDGGTFDMGIQALSGAAERGTDFIYVCYDNEAYMNTGVQGSSATPAGAITTTTPVVPKQQLKKGLMRIMEAHNIAYLATVSSSYPNDVYEKFLRAKEIRGTKFFHLAVPCPTGWWYPTRNTVKIGRLMIESCVFPLYEIEGNSLRLTGKSLNIAKSGRKKPIDEYIASQGRFRKITPEQVATYQEVVDRRWEYLLGRSGF